jgi:hypothetical protein
MNRRRITFNESCARECVLKLVKCGGPTAHGLEGYICENCASFLVAQFEVSSGLSNQRCSYCGGQPTHKTTGQFRVCQSCAAKALKTAKWWYSCQ